MRRFRQVSCAARCLCLCSRSLFQEDDKGAEGAEGESELLRPLSRFETAKIVALARQRRVPCSPRNGSLWESMYRRKSTLRGLIPLFKEKCEQVYGSPLRWISVRPRSDPLDLPPSVPVLHAVFGALRAIHTSQYEHSFAAGLHHAPQTKCGLIAVGLESRVPWSLLMDDVRDHYALAQSVTLYTRVNNTVLISSISPERDQPENLRTLVTHIPSTISLEPHPRAFSVGILGGHRW